MVDSAAAWGPGDWAPTRRSSRARPEPEDDGPAQISRIHPARGVVESTIYRAAACAQAMNSACRGSRASRAIRPPGISG